MSIASEISRLQTAKSNIKTAIENKGVTVSSDLTISSYAGLIDEIPTGGGAIENAIIRSGKASENILANSFIEWHSAEGSDTTPTGTSIALNIVCMAPYGNNMIAISQANSRNLSIHELSFSYNSSHQLVITTLRTKALNIQGVDRFRLAIIDNYVFLTCGDSGAATFCIPIEITQDSFSKGVLYYPNGTTYTAPYAHFNDIIKYSEDDTTITYLSAWSSGSAQSIQTLKVQYLTLYKATNTLSLTSQTQSFSSYGQMNNSGDDNAVFMKLNNNYFVVFGGTNYGYIASYQLEVNTSTSMISTYSRETLTGYSQPTVYKDGDYVRAIWNDTTNSVLKTCLFEVKNWGLVKSNEISLPASTGSGFLVTGLKADNFIMYFQVGTSIYVYVIKKDNVIRTYPTTTSYLPSIGNSIGHRFGFNPNTYKFYTSLDTSPSASSFSSKIVDFTQEGQALLLGEMLLRNSTIYIDGVSINDISSENTGSFYTI